MTEPVLADIPHIESWLLETDGEDIVGKSRQKHLEEVEVGQLLSLQLNSPYEQRADYGLPPGREWAGKIKSSAARSESCLSTRKAKKTEDQTATEASNSSSGFFRLILKQTKFFH